MDALIQEVLRRLTLRMTSSATITVSHDAVYDEHILLEHQLISFTGVHYGHIRELATYQMTPWISYLHSAIAYDCDVTIRMAVPVTALMSPSVIIDWPVTFVDKLGRSLYAFREAFVTASLIRACESQSVIVLFRGQRITMAGQDEIERKQITVIEGNEKYASR